MACDTRKIFQRDRIPDPVALGTPAPHRGVGSRLETDDMNIELKGRKAIVTG